MSYSDGDSKTKVVLGILHSIVESNFLVPSVRTDNAKELAREILRRGEGSVVRRQSGSVSEVSASLPPRESVFSKEFVKFCGSLVDTIGGISTPDHHLKSLKTQRQRIWSRFHVARFGELQELWTDIFNKLKIDNSDTGETN